MQTLKTDIRQRILYAAHREFIRNGVRQTSIRTVATQAGVAVGNVYHYFRSKDELFCEVMRPLLRALDHYILSHNDEEFLSLDVFDLRQQQINHIMAMLTLLSSSSALSCGCCSSMPRVRRWQTTRTKSSTTRCRLSLIHI